MGDDWDLFVTILLQILMVLNKSCPPSYRENSRINRKTAETFRASKCGTMTRLL